MNSIVFKILRFSGMPWVFRNFIQKDKVSILMFHEIDVKTASKTFAYLLKKYNIISLNDYLRAHINADKSNLPKKALIITFDDGHASNYELLKIVKEHNIPISIFLCSSIIDTNRHYWYKCDKTTMPINELKKLSNKKRLESLLKDGFKQDEEYEEPQALSKNQIIEMSEHVNFQTHTKFHPCLPYCEYDEAKEEISGSKKILEDIFDFEINAIAFPNGDYSDRDIELTKDAGYTCALTVDHGYNTLESDLFRLKRLSSNDTKDLNELIVKSSGLWGFIRNLI